MSITCIAIDDEPKALEVVSLHASKVPFLDLRHTFRNPVEALSYLSSHHIELVFADINMPGLTGLQLSRMLQPHQSVIFTTAYREYAAESYEIDAIDYLLKPIEFDRFMQAALKARERITPKESKLASTPQHRTGSIFIKSGSAHHHVQPADILYVKKDGNYAEFHLPGKKILSRLTMDQVMQLLDADHFLRVHKSYVVAKAHIAVVRQSSLTVGDVDIPVSQSYRENVQRALLNRSDQ